MAPHVILLMAANIVKLIQSNISRHQQRLQDEIRKQKMHLMFKLRFKERFFLRHQGSN